MSGSTPIPSHQSGHGKFRNPIAKPRLMHAPVVILRISPRQSTLIFIVPRLRTTGSPLAGITFPEMLLELLSRVSSSSLKRCPYFQPSALANCIDLLHSEDSYWQQVGPLEQKDIRLMVKHVFITSEFGSDRLPKWASWVRVIIDADDLPLNVSRETLQSSKFMKQMKSIILRHLLILFNKLVTEDEEKWALVTKNYGMIFKFGAVEDTKNRDRLVNLVRFETTQRQNITLDQVSGIPVVPIGRGADHP